ncbi:conserved hypothetical protein [Haloferula helveola]|uniref:Uncharacterized protein n=1 Tax=Haloferula helveola TaxID=490095 RepID=A0ABM7R9P9_9BACT|nr:conserved hypothetical protein [Haloferula helveola]
MKWLILLGVFGLTACDPVVPPAQTTASMEPAPSEWNAWAAWVEEQRPVGDGQGHGPDVGSDEWAMAIDRNLGISSDGHGPDLKSAEWRMAVESKL